MSDFDNDWNMACPTCKRTDKIDIQALVWVRLLPDGTDPDLTDDRSHIWDDGSKACCTHCGTSGAVWEFKCEETT